jgi:hypothetical protein
MARMKFSHTRIGAGTKCTASISYVCGFKQQESVIDVDYKLAHSEAKRILNLRIAEHKRYCKGKH